MSRSVSLRHTATQGTPERFQRASNRPKTVRGTSQVDVKNSSGEARINTCGVGPAQRLHVLRDVAPPHRERDTGGADGAFVPTLCDLPQERHTPRTRHQREGGSYSHDARGAVSGSASRSHVHVPLSLAPQHPPFLRCFLLSLLLLIVLSFLPCFLLSLSSF